MAEVLNKKNDYEVRLKTAEESWKEEEDRRVGLQSEVESLQAMVDRYRHQVCTLEYYYCYRIIAIYCLYWYGSVYRCRVTFNRCNECDEMMHMCFDCHPLTQTRLLLKFL